MKNKKFILSINNNEFVSTLFLTLLYGFFFVVLQYFLFNSGMLNYVPNANTLCKWDCNVYENIMREGYTYYDPQHNNTGCYILLPWIWKLLHVGVLGMSCISYIFFAIGFSFLTQIYKLSVEEKLLWLSVPTVYIMMIPYTEALFFLLVCLAFWGIDKNIKWLICISLFLASLTRATAIFLIPAFLIAELIYVNRKNILKSTLNYIIYLATPIALGTLFFIWYQHHAIGVWFAYFTQQRIYEGHKFAMPIFPLSSMEGERNLWISAVAVFVCMLCLAVIVKICYKALVIKVREQDKLFIVSIAFLVITLYKTIFYNPTWGTNTTLTIGISRYVFSTPFFYVFLHYFTNNIKQYNIYTFINMFLFCNLAWLICGSYFHIATFIYFNFCTIIVFLYMLLNNKALKWVPIVLTSFNFLLQIIMFQQYLSGRYLD